MKGGGERGPCYIGGAGVGGGGPLIIQKWDGGGSTIDAHLICMHVCWNEKIVKITAKCRFHRMLLNAENVECFMSSREVCLFSTL